MGTSEMSPENVLEGLHKHRLQGSEQLQTMFAMYNQELSGDRVAPSYQKFKRMVRQHSDQTIRTRNFKVWNEEFGTRALVKSRKGRIVSAERKVENAFNGKQMDSVQKETPVVLSEHHGIKPLVMLHQWISQCWAKAKTSKADPTRRKKPRRKQQTREGGQHFVRECFFSA